MPKTKETQCVLELRVLEMETLVQGIIATCPRNHETLPLLINLRETLDTFESEFYNHWHKING